MLFRPPIHREYRQFYQEPADRAGHGRWRGEYDLEVSVPPLYCTCRYWKPVVQLL